MDIEKREDIIGKVQHRTFRLDRASVNQEARTVELAFSSEAPVERWWGMEILDHSPESVRLGRMMDGAPVLFNHDVDNHLGVVESARIDSDRVGRAVARFSKCDDAEMRFQDVLDGILTKVSVGYIVHAMQLEKKEGDLSFYRCTDWEPIEISMVTIPADNTVGVGRNHVPTDNPNRGGNKMPEEKKEVPAPAALSQEEISRIKEAAVRAEGERRDAIEAIAARFAGRIPKIDELRDEARQKGWTAEYFKGQCADRLTDSKPIDAPEIGMTDKEVRAYSFRKALLHLAGMAYPGLRGLVDASFEIDCSEAVNKKLGSTSKGLRVPYDVLSKSVDDYRAHPDYRQFLRRDLTVGSATAGGNLVGTNLLAGSFIELLRNKMLLYNLGARQLTGLVGNIAIPRQSGAGTAVWETEATGNTSESAQTYDQVTMSPNEVSAYTEISHKLLLQATPGIEGLIQDDIARVLAIAIDLAGFHGSGGTQPTGIAGTSGVGSVAGAGFGWDAIVEFETDVEVGNALNGSLAYVTDPTTRGLLKTRPKVSGYPEFLMDRDGRLNTFPCFSSNQITAGAMFFGDFSQVLVGEWGSLELQVNPFIKDVEGLIRIVGRQAVDIGVRHGGAFSYSSTMS